MSFNELFSLYYSSLRRIMTKVMKGYEFCNSLLYRIFAVSYILRTFTKSIKRPEIYYGRWSVGRPFYSRLGGYSLFRYRGSTMRVVLIQETRSNMTMARSYLYLMAAAIWGIPGVIITAKGVGAYTQVMQSQLWWLMMITSCVIMGFYFIFRSITRRYIERIASLSSRCRLWHTFPTKGWFLLLFMMSLGVALRHIPFIPIQFTASFYSALGPMLFVSSLRFLYAMMRTNG